MCDTTLENIKQLKNPFIWCAADGSVLVADNGIPVESFDASTNWIKVWIDKVRDLGYDVDGWRVICGGVTTKIKVIDDKIFLEKL